ncbi:MAG: hypothetical protein ACE5ER_08290 [Nitrospinaceae bacterium]
MWAVLRFWGYGRNDLKVRLGKWRQLAREAADPAERRAREAVLAQVEALRSRWFLAAEDLDLAAGSTQLLQAVASAYHPDAPDPMTRARIGALLDGFLEMKNQLSAWVRRPGWQALTRVRLRHVWTFQAVWDKKRAWEETPLVRTLRRLRLGFFLNCGMAVYRFGDALYWAGKSGIFLIHDVFLKRLLMRWRLTLGETALKVYQDRRPSSDLPDDDVLGDLESLSSEPPEEVEADLPPEVRDIVRGLRRDLLFHDRPLSRPWVGEQYGHLVDAIAAFHHPQSADPRLEATLYDLMQGLARLCEAVAQLRSRPVICKVLDLRLSHLIKVKAAADTVLDSQWMDFLKKYKVGATLKYTTLALRAFRKGQPGLVFKDVAFTLAREGLLRWLALYFHGRIALESHRIYQVKRTP